MKARFDCTATITARGPTYSFNWHQSGLAPVAERHDNTRLCAFREEVGKFVTLFLQTRHIKVGSDLPSDRPQRQWGQFCVVVSGTPTGVSEPDFLQRWIDCGNVLPGFVDLRLAQKGSDYRELQVEFCGARWASRPRIPI